MTLCERYMFKCTKRKALRADAASIENQRQNKKRDIRYGEFSVKIRIAVLLLP